MHHPIDKIAHTTAFVTPVVEHWLERETAQWVHHRYRQCVTLYITLLEFTAYINLQNTTI